MCVCLRARALARAFARVLLSERKKRGDRQTERQADRHRDTDGENDRGRQTDDRYEGTDRYKDRDSLCVVLESPL